MARRETRNRSLPVESTCASSVMGGSRPLVGGGRPLPQQPQGIEPALLDRARRPRQLGGPAKLAFNLLDELANLRRCRLGLLVLNADQGRLVVAIIEENFKNPVG